MENYIVQKGDSLWKIAGKNNISLEALIAANPQIRDVNSIMPGMSINIPANPIPKSGKRSEKYISIAAEQTPETEPEYDFECDICSSTKQEKPFIYTCVKHDSLDKIAERFLVSKAMLIYCNPQLKEIELLQAGDKLFIPGLDPALSMQEASFCFAEESEMMEDEDSMEEEIHYDCCSCPYCGKKLKIIKCIN